MVGTSGFSFIDLSADLAGIAFANKLKRDASALTKIRDEFTTDAHMPTFSGLREGFNTKRFERVAPGVGNCSSKECVPQLMSGCARSNSGESGNGCTPPQRTPPSEIPPNKGFCFSSKYGPARSLPVARAVASVAEENGPISKVVRFGSDGTLSQRSAAVKTRSGGAPSTFAVRTPCKPRSARSTAAREAESFQCPAAGC